MSSRGPIFVTCIVILCLGSAHSFDFPSLLRLRDPRRELRAAFRILSRGSETLASLGAAPNFFNQVSAVSATAAEVLDAREKLRRQESVNDAVLHKSGVIPDETTPVVYDAYLANAGYDRWHISEIYHPDWAFKWVPGDGHAAKAQYLIHALQNSLNRHSATHDRLGFLQSQAPPSSKLPAASNVTRDRETNDNEFPGERKIESSLYEQHLTDAREAVEDLTEECLKTTPHQTIADCMKHLLIKHRSYFQFGEPSKNFSAPLEPVLLSRIDFSSYGGFKLSLGNVHVFGISNGLTKDRLQISLLRYPNPYSSLSYLRFSMLVPSVAGHGLFNFDQTAMDLIFPKADASKSGYNHVGFFRGNIKWVQVAGDGYILNFPDGSALATNVNISFDFSEWSVHLRSRRNPELSEKMTKILNDRNTGKYLLDKLAIPIADSLASIFSQIFADVFMASSKKKKPREVEEADRTVSVHVDSPEESQKELLAGSQDAIVPPNNATSGGLFDLEALYAELFGKFNSRTRWNWEEYKKHEKK